MMASLSSDKGVTWAASVEQASETDQVENADANRSEAADELLRAIAFAVQEVKQDLRSLTSRLFPDGNGGNEGHALPQDATASADGQQARLEGSDMVGFSSPEVRKERSKKPSLTRALSDLPQVEFDREISSEEKQDGFVAPTLPVWWPSSLCLREAFRASGASVRFDWENSVAAAQIDGSAATSILTDFSHPKFLSERARHPSNWFNTSFDIMGMCVLLYDLTVVPYLIAWQEPTQGFTKFAAYFSVIFWTLDIGVSCVKGFYKNGELILEGGEILRHYLTTWFILDITLVIGDWLNIVVSAIASDSSFKEGRGFVRILKMAKVLRLLGLMRMFRVMKVATVLFDSILSESVRLMVRLSVLCWCTLWVNHILACAWFAVGTFAPSDTGTNWIVAYEVTEEDTTSVYQYFSALHWSIAQITLGAMEISPSNTVERGFTIICLIVGLLFGSTLVSTLSATMVDLHALSRDKSQKMRSLRQYLREHGISRATALRVQRQADERLSQVDRLTSKDVPALTLLAHALQQELHVEICGCHVLRLPLLLVFKEIDGTWFRNFCEAAVEVIFPKPGDDVFHAGRAATAAYYLVRGSMCYMQKPRSSAVETKTQVMVSLNSWVCEPALWLEWLHVGTARVMSSCNLATICCEAFASALKSHSGIRSLAAEYGQAFHRRVMAAKPPNLEYPTDLEVPFTDFGDIVSGLSQEARMAIAGVALAARRIHHLRISGNNHRWGHLRTGTSDAEEKLKDEVAKGKAVLILNSEGDLERVVSLVVAHISREDGASLVQLGTWQESAAKPDIKLPGVKRNNSESYSDAWLRLVEAKLWPLADCIEVQHVQQEVSKQASKTFGEIVTKYYRAAFHACLKGDFEAPVCQAIAPIFTTSRSSTKAAGFLHGADEHSVYWVDHDAAVYLYAWLQPEELDALRGPGGEQDLAAWLGLLRPPEAYWEELKI